MTDRRTTSLPASLRTRLLLIATILLVLALGAAEDLYGNTDSADVFGSDGLQYLDIARAIGRGDWHSALNPLWSQGYPLLLAAARPLFPAGSGGDWTTTRVTNFGIFIFDHLAFLFLLTGVIDALPSDGEKLNKRRAIVWIGGLSIFVSTQVCLGQVSRVSPDELVMALFFLASGALIRLLNRPHVYQGSLLGRALLLGIALGIGFIVKAIFLALGCGVLALWALDLLRGRRGLKPLILAGGVFVVFVGSYGATLSHEVGHVTLGEAGSINYAWHVNRLQKWVHWEGGTEPADEAWPKPWIARFAQWDTHPPDFGRPIHPSTVLQRSPLVYGFDAPFHATYTPYYNPPYWYEGYRHLIRPRFQLIAIAKSLGDLARVLITQPILLCALLAMICLTGSVNRLRELLDWLAPRWVVPAAALLGVAIYLPVHLEGRYLGAFLATLALVGLASAAAVADLDRDRRTQTALALILLGVGAELTLYDRPVLRNMLAHRSPENNEEWQVGDAILEQHLPEMSKVGVIAWTPNLHCDWAYFAHLQITSEIASKADDDMFWQMSPAQQQQTLATFARTGAVAVFSRDKPANTVAPGWQRLGNTPMWIYRLP